MKKYFLSMILIIFISQFSYASNKDREVPVLSPEETSWLQKTLVGSIACISVERRDTGQEKFSGSGFFIAPGVVATDYHVIYNAREIFIQLADGRKTPIEHVIYCDKEKDLCFLAVDISIKQGLGMTDVSPENFGQKVYVAGFVDGCDNLAFSVGLLEGTNEDEGLSYLSASTKCTAGMSGGPMINNNGVPIGIVRGASIINSYETETFALPLWDNAEFVKLDQKVELDQLIEKPWQAYFTDGLYADIEKDYHAVIKHMTVVLEKRPKYLQAYFLRGIAYTNLGLNKEAIEDFNMTISIDSNYAPAYFYRGLNCDFIGNKRKAIDDYNKAINIYPQMADAYYNRGYDYLYSGNLDNAISDFTNAIDNNPDHGEAYHKRAIAYNAKRQFAKSRDDVKKAQKLGVRIEAELLKALGL